MEEKEFVFFSTYYDKELLRQAVILLNENGCKYRILDRSSHPTGRAPLSRYIETDLLITINDFDKAAELLMQEDS